MNASGHEFGLVFLLAGVLVLYLLPTLIAYVRGRRVAAILALNLLTGWTVAGWVWSLLLAVW